MPTINEAIGGALHLLEANRLEEAKQLCDQIIRAAPTNADGLFVTGLVAQQSGRLDEAATLYRRVLDTDPSYVDAWNNLGNVQSTLGNPAAAADCYRHAISLEPGMAVSYYNLGNALMKLGDGAAIECYRHAAQLAPSDPDMHNNLGQALRRQGQPTAAVESFRRAVALKPDFVDAHAGLGNAYLELGRFDEAVASSRHALAFNAGGAHAHSDLIFNLNFDEGIDATEQQAERARWHERHAAALAPATLPQRDRDPERRLRVGYVSAHFRAYAATFAFGGVLTNHDPAQVEVFCYSDTDRADDITPIIHRAASQWRNTAAMSDIELAAQIERDQIDILVDLVGHMSGHRLLTFARKPAPIQITAWGEPTGTGLKTMDYILADPVLIPEADRPLFAEDVIDLPGALGWWTPKTLPAPGPLPAKANGFVTFGSFNRRGKITPAVQKSWAAILTALPTARLTLKNKGFGDPVEQAEARAAFAASGLPLDRVTFLGQTGRDDHFSAYRGLDIALDPFPHGGGMTTLDALAMGVPVITRPGLTPSSRLAASVLTALGLERFIAHDEASYQAAALKLAGDLDGLAKLRAALPEMLATSAIGDPLRYARAVEAAYREAWRRYCATAN